MVFWRTQQLVYLRCSKCARSPCRLGLFRLNLFLADPFSLRAIIETVAFACSA
jgi:hypothetical protein